MKDFYVSKSHEDGVAIATDLLRDVVGMNRDQATIIGLSGELGSGKTTWTKALVDYLGGDPDQVASPTFLLMRNYDLGENIYNFTVMYHLDAYRLKSSAELKALKLDREFKNPNNIFVIEWFEKVKSVLPKPITTISFEEINDFTRTLSVKHLAYE